MVSRRLGNNPLKIYIYDPDPQNHTAEVTLSNDIQEKTKNKIFGQNSATPVIVGRGPAELREAKKRPSHKHHRKQPVAASRLTNTQTYNLKNRIKKPKSDLLQEF